jgi:8-oxo-dGTP pyrophosphatase MutT (NUDIX family)
VSKINELPLKFNGFIKINQDTKTGDEIVCTTNSIVFLIHLVDTKKIVFIEQSRSPMKNNKNKKGTIIELPAGRFDLKISVSKLAVKEASEEVGATISEKDVTILNEGKPIALSPGVLTEKMYLAYIPITTNQIEKKDRIFGKKDEGEKIKRFFIPVNELKQ